VQIPSGFNTSGALIGTRSAAPFAILDTLYAAVSTVLTASPTANFPLLTIDWATDNVGGETYYNDNSGGDNRVIVISGQVNVDTDEYDQHVVAHEFGHYLEDRFARSDSIGGPHTFADRLHPSVAFGEGFGTAFAAMVLNDSRYRDTTGTGQAQGLSVNIETNSVTNPGWFSEASAYAILWDLFDSAADGADNLALGFAPIWQVMTGAQRTNDALTSIFSFVTYLKQQNGGSVAGIDALVSSHSIVANTIDIFGATETNMPLSPPTIPPTTDIFPLFTPITINGPSQTVRSIGIYGLYNKLSVSRFLRFDVPTTQNVRIRVVAGASSGALPRDVDAFLMRRGVGVVLSQEPADEDFTRTLAAGSYVLMVYDYDNFDEGPAANTSITVTVSN
jgi:hypothetical protein